MKKTISFIILLTLSFCLFSIPANAVFLPYVHHTNRGELEYRIELGEAMVTDWTNHEVTDIVILEEIDGYPVTKTFDWVTSLGGFVDKSITSVSFPDTITSIGNHSFGGHAITKLVLPDSVTRIGYAAFARNPITEIKMSENIEFIDGFAFSETPFVQNATEPIYFGDILYCVPESMSGIITVKEGTRSVSPYAFYNCAGVTEVVIPEGVVFIGNNCFEGCTSLEKISFPSTLENIGETPFLKCNKLSSVNISDKNKNYKLKEGCFIEAGSGTLLFAPVVFGQLKLPENCGIKIIAPFCFAEKDIYKLTLPEGITEIGDSAFKDNHIDDISLPDSLRIINSSAFSGNRLYNTASLDEDFYIGKHLIRARSDASGEYTVKAGTISIADGAFYGKRDITKIILPEGLKAVGSGAFAECSSLTEVIFPDSVEHIGDRPFAENNSLTKSNIPKALTEINTGLFAGCANLESLEIPSSITSIGKSAFFGFEKLDGTLVIPDGTTVLEYGTIEGCTSLDKIVLPSSLAKIEADNFPDYNFNPETKIVYKGTKEDFDKIIINELGNTALLTAEISYEPEEKASTDSVPKYIYTGLGVGLLGGITLVIIKLKNRKKEKS